MHQRLQFLLLQTRDEHDAMRGQEVQCFASSFGCLVENIRTLDLLRYSPSTSQLDRADVVLMGGSGDYSVAQGGPWLERALDVMREVAERGRPAFASCFGFQLLARALGGHVQTDLGRAELGTIPLFTTGAAAEDPVFRPLPHEFSGHAGHQDVVDRLPPGAVRLARSELVANQAYGLIGKPIYCTQFHPELRMPSLMQRVRQYPQYVEKILGLTLAEFEERCHETQDSGALLPRFLDVCFPSG